MAEGEDQKTEPAEGESAEGKENKVDADVWPSVKNIAGIATIAVTLVGAWTGIYQLRLKAQADKDTSYNNAQAEANKLDLGKLQLKQQLDLHTLDGDLEVEKRKAELAQAKDQAETIERKEERNRLSAQIAKMFDGDGTKEAEIASLFEYLKLDPTSSEIVENAVLAKLENPKSTEEIDLGFGLMEKIGPAAWDSVIRANCAARDKYDAYIADEFIHLFDERAQSGGAAKIDQYDLRTADDVAGHLAMQAALGTFYALAMAQLSIARFDFSQKLDEMRKVDPPDPLRLQLSIAAINRSNTAIANLLERFPERDHRINFSRAFITNDTLQRRNFSGDIGRFECHDCFLELRYLRESGVRDTSAIKVLARVFPGALVAELFDHTYPWRGTNAYLVSFDQLSTDPWGGFRIQP